MEHRASRRGFTLVELILVIAILAIVASIALGKFGDLRAKAAKRVNISNMQLLTRSAHTYVIASDTTTGIFNKMESLLDVSNNGNWTGTPGTYDWTKVADVENGEQYVIPGIYQGPKSVVQISDATGAGPDTTDQDLVQQRKNNNGTTSDLYKKLGVYYLSASDVTKFKNAGISDYMMHNYTAGQSALFGFAEHEDGTPLDNTGPGFRADRSAFYKATLKAGSPVVMLHPLKAASIYRTLGCDLELSADDKLMDIDALIAAGKLKYRLFCFGLGNVNTFALSALDSIPRCEVIGKDYYRNYIMVFKQPTSGPSGQPVSFAGVLDPYGRTIEDVRFNTDWY